MPLPKGTLSGYPETIGEIADADSVLMMEFGSDPTLRTNEAIVDYVYRNEILRDLPMFVSGSIAKILQAREYPMDDVQVFKGPSAAGVSENTGTYGELLQLHDYRIEHPGKFERPVLATVGYNAGNIRRQSELDTLNLTGLIVPEGLPRLFDWRSDQLWTKMWPFWAMVAPVRHRRLIGKGH